MNVKQKFIELTDQTYPHGTEELLIGKLPSYLKKDEFGNLFHQIGDNPSTMFTCHLDTASSDQSKVKHVIKDNFIYSDGTTILGADDKAGVVILLYMMEHNITGLYYFFLGEERGCVGSRKLASKHQNNPLNHIKKVVSFDRRGYDSVITHQLSGRSCSDKFAEELSKEINSKSKVVLDKPFEYEPDPTGIYTDSAQFTQIYSECTNISVGYHNEHTKHESQDIYHLENLCKTVVLIDWDSLDSHRDPKSNRWYDDDLDYGYGKSYSSYTNKYQNQTYGYDDYGWESTPKSTKETIVVLDTKYYGHESEVVYDYNTLEINSVKLHPGRIMEEKSQIDHLLSSLEVEYDDLEWNGNTLTIKQNLSQSITMKREEVSDYLSSINDWIETEIKYKSFSGI